MPLVVLAATDGGGLPQEFTPAARERLREINVEMQRRLAASVPGGRLIELLGVGHTALYDGEHGEPLAFAVRRIHVDYLKPARIDDLVEVETTVRAIAGARLVLWQIVKRGGETLVQAEVTVVLVNPDGRARRLPPRVRQRLTEAAGE